MVSGFIQNAKVSSSDLEKGEQVIVELVLVRPGQIHGVRLDKPSGWRS